MHGRIWLLRFLCHGHGAKMPNLNEALQTENCSILSSNDKDYAEDCGWSEVTQAIERSNFQMNPPANCQDLQILMTLIQLYTTCFHPSSEKRYHKAQLTVT
ncbi:unnamed protein product [Protopolystoma xenopodis]|uniref:Uncharacterized protein n=1 Tax=Protopolystoma xenopodis TaxID=117903 RepID=A0A3S5FH61_9PLAT|nr:unnamed protein product [Protopolystoma xenopodis]